MLKATQDPGTFADGAPVSTATGVYLYVAMAGMLSILAAIPTIMLARDGLAAQTVPDAPQRPGSPAVDR